MLGHPGFTRWTYDSSDPEKSPDEVLDDITLYWLTGTAAWSRAGSTGSTAGAALPFSGPEKATEISLPVAITVFPGESYRAPETWARRAYRNLIYFNEVDRGGHFAAWEQPELFSTEIRAASAAAPADLMPNGAARRPAPQDADRAWCPAANAHSRAHRRRNSTGENHDPLPRKALQL